MNADQARQLRDNYNNAQTDQLQRQIDETLEQEVFPKIEAAAESGKSEILIPFNKPTPWTYSLGELHVSSAGDIEGRSPEVIEPALIKILEILNSDPYNFEVERQYNGIMVKW